MSLNFRGTNFNFDPNTATQSVDEYLSGGPKVAAPVSTEPVQQEEKPLSRIERAAQNAMQQNQQREDNRFEQPVREQPVDTQEQSARPTSVLQDIGNIQQAPEPGVDTRAVAPDTGQFWNGTPSSITADQYAEWAFNFNDETPPPTGIPQSILNPYIEPTPEPVSQSWSNTAGISEDPTDDVLDKFEQYVPSNPAVKHSEYKVFEEAAKLDAVSDEPVSSGELLENREEEDSNTQERMDRTQKGITKDLTWGFFPLTGDTLTHDEDGSPRVVHSSDVSDELAISLANAGWDPYSAPIDMKRALFVGFQSYHSMSIDRNGKMFHKNQPEDGANKEPERLVISDTEFIKYLRTTRTNARAWGDPFFNSQPGYKFAGKVRYPNLMTSLYLDFWTTKQNDNNLLKGVSKETLRDRNVKQWVEVVEPALMAEADVAQREAVLDMRDAVVLMSKGIGKADTFKRRAEKQTLNEVLDVEKQIEMDTALSENLLDSYKATSEYALRARERLRRERDYGHKKRRVRTYRDSNKELDETVVNIATSGEPLLVDRVFRMIASLGVVAGTAARIPLAVSAPFEAAQGLGIHSVNTMWRSFNLSRTYLDGETFRPVTKEILNEVTPEMVSEVMGAMNIIESVANGFDTIMAKIMNGDSLAQPGLIKRNAQAGQEVDTKSQKLTNALSDLSAASMDITTGEYAFRHMRVRLWLKQTLLNLQDPNLDSGLYVDQQDVLNGLRTDPQGTIHKLLQMEAGKMALQDVSNTTMGGIDPVVNFMMLMGTRYPRSEFLIRAATSWFWRYGWRATMRIIPLSNTAMYAIKTFGIDPARRWRGHAEGEIQDSRQYLYAGQEDKMTGLAMNFQLDCVQFGGTAFAATLVCLTMLALGGGIEPPDDEDRFGHLWYEWKIGGVPIKESWYSNDLFGVGMPTAIAIMAALHSGDHAAGQIFWNGATDKVYGGSPLGSLADTFDMLNNFNRNYVEAQMRSEGNLDAGKIEMDNFFWTQMRGFAIRRGISTFEPAVIRDFYNDFGFLRPGEAARSKNVIWNDKTNDPNDPDTLNDVQQVTYAESELRRNIYNSPFAGMFMNILTGAGFDNGTNGKTGYMRYQMPEIARIDETQKSLADLLRVFDSEGNQVAIDQWEPEQKAQIVNQTLDIIASGDPSWLAQQGYVIPYDARISATLYLEERKQLLWNLVYRKDEIKGYFSDDYEENDRMMSDEFDKTKAEVKRLDALKANLWSDQLPYSPTKYGRWETSYRTRYFYKESGDAANPLTMMFDTVFNKGRGVGIDLYASGDNKSPILPWGAVQNPWDSFNAQTPAAWQGDLTDYEMIEKRDKGVTIAQGSNQGKNLWDLETGGQGRSMQGGQAWDPTLVFPERGHFAQDQPFIKKPSSDEFKALAQKLGYAVNSGGTSTKLKSDDLSGLNVDLQAELVDMESAENKASNSWRSYGGGGGGGGYTPNIYSHAGFSLNGGKPQGIYTQTPYRTNFDYLRPSVETKGSREAYRREDI